MPLWNPKDAEGQRGEAACHSSPRWATQQSRKPWEIRVPKAIMWPTEGPCTAESPHSHQGKPFWLSRWRVGFRPHRRWHTQGGPRLVEQTALRPSGLPSGPPRCWAVQMQIFCPGAGLPDLRVWQFDVSLRPSDLTSRLLELPIRCSDILLGAERE